MKHLQLKHVVSHAMFGLNFINRISKWMLQLLFKEKKKKKHSFGLRKPKAALSRLLHKPTDQDFIWTFSKPSLSTKFWFLTQCWKPFQEAADGFTVSVKLQNAHTRSNGHYYKRHLQIKWGKTREIHQLLLCIIKNIIVTLLQFIF